MASVTRADVASLTPRDAQDARQANQTLAVLSKMFTLAEVWGMRPDDTNPTRHVQRYKENKRQRYLSGKNSPVWGMHSPPWKAARRTA